MEAGGSSLEVGPEKSRFVKMRVEWRFFKNDPLDGILYSVNALTTRERGTSKGRTKGETHDRGFTSAHSSIKREERRRSP